MIYKYLPAIEGEQRILARIDDDNKCRMTCTEQHPEYLAWVAEGNTPLAASTEVSVPAEENQ